MRCAGGKVKGARGISGTMKPILSLITSVARGVALLLASACAAAAILGQGGRFNRLLDVLNNFEPVWLLGGLLAAAIWLLAGRAGRITAWLAAAAVAISALQMAPELLSRRDRVAAAPGVASLKLVQFNVFEGNPDPLGSARWILAQNADIVVIQEGAGWAEPMLAMLRQRYPYQTTCARHAPCSTNIFSRRKPIAEGGQQEPGMRAGVATAWAVYPDTGGPIPVVGVHLTWPYPTGIQRFQSCWISNLVDGMPKRRLIIAGDFNLTPWAFDMGRKDRRFGIPRLDQAMATFPNGRLNPFPIWAPVPLMPIDHVYAGKGWGAVSVVRGPRTGSDHFPVVVTLAPQPGQAEPWSLHRPFPTCN